MSCVERTGERGQSLCLVPSGATTARRPSSVTQFCDSSRDRRLLNSRSPLATSRQRTPVQYLQNDGVPPTTVKAALVILSGHPGADVRRTVAKYKAFAGVAVAQQTHRVTIRQDQIGQVQQHHGTRRLCVDQLAQFAYVFGVEAAADRQHDGPVDRALNLQQRHDGAERNCRSNRTRPNLRAMMDARRTRFRQW